MTSVVAGCGFVLGLEAPEFDDPPTREPSFESGAGPDGSGQEQPQDDGGDANVILGTDAAPFDDPTRWSFWADAGGAGGFITGPFDGRYLYFIRGRDPYGSSADASVGGPQPAGRVLRLDTTADFTTDAAWSVFDPASRFPTIQSQLAASLDGRYLILASYQTNHFLRFDTANASSFNSFAAWELFDSSAIALNANSYGAAVDVPGATYFVPERGNHPILRHMSGTPIVTGWSARVNALADGGGPQECPWARGAACVGSFVFFGPSNGANSGECFLRFEPSKGMGPNDAWETFRFSSLSPLHHEFLGVVGTQSHAYFTRYSNALTDGGGPFYILRKSADSPLDAGWETQSSTVRNGKATGNVGGVFDGRYLYFAPSPTNGSTSTVYARYDTLRPFSDPASWDSVEHSAVNVPATSHQGAAFDGQYIYYPAWNVVGGAPRAAMIRYRAYDTKISVPARCSYQ